jgi:hypothetical protein
MRSLSLFHVLLDLQLLDADQKARANLVGAMLKQAPLSQIYANTPAIQTELKNLQATYTTLVAAGATAAASGKQHTTDVAAEQQALVANNKSLNLLRTLTENAAGSVKDVTDMAFDAYEGKAAAIPLEPPQVIQQKPGKKGTGKVDVVVYETGTRQHYAAQMSPNPIGTSPSTWVTLFGNGKSRKLTGASGTSVWVQFALVRGQQQSAWSVAVLVTFP